MILIINDEIKIQGKPEECIDFLKRYNKEFTEDKHDKLENHNHLNLFDLFDNYKDKNPIEPPVIKYSNDSWGCEGCLYYQQMLSNPLKKNQLGDTPCTWCPKRQAYC